MSNLLSGFIYFIGGAMLWLITSLIGGTIEGLGGGEKPTFISAYVHRWDYNDYRTYCLLDYYSNQKQI